MACSNPSRRSQMLTMPAPELIRRQCDRCGSPGASPLLFGKFLMASTAFVTLEDIAAYLPSYEESVVEVEMDVDLGEAYAGIEQDIREAVKKNRGNRSLMSLMMHRLLLYPDHPFGIGEIWGKRFNPTIGGFE